MSFIKQTIEQDVKAIRQGIRKMNNHDSQNSLISYHDALERVRNELSSQLLELAGSGSNDINNKNQISLEELKTRYEQRIADIINLRRLNIADMTGAEFVKKAVSEFVGYSILEQAMADPKITDIYIIDYQTIYVEKSGTNYRYPLSFESQKHCDNFIKRLVTTAGKNLDVGESKIVDFELYGNRGCATSDIITLGGSSLTLRKHGQFNVTYDDLITQGVLSPKLGDLLKLLIKGESNLICAGITGSGKTTTLRALLNAQVKGLNKRAIVIEDTPELGLDVNNCLSFTTFKSDNPTLAVSQRDLIYAALRLKPKYIIVGEVRGPEAEAAVEAMETGHSTIFSMHAGKPINAVNRLVTKYLIQMPSIGTDVANRIIGEAVDYIFLQDDIPGVGRRVSRLTEISYDNEKNKIIYKDICVYDIEQGEWKWLNTLSEDKIYKASRRGVKPGEFHAIFGKEVTQH